VKSLTTTACDLADRLRLVIERGVDTPLPEAEFNRLALDLFAFQYAECAVYRAYCDQCQATPATVRGWDRIPAVPTSAFKDFPLVCFPVADAVAEFRTSGTTRSETGRHYFPTLALYHAALHPNFAAHVLPDGARLPLLVLAPSPADAPHSSLAHMFGELVRAFGTVDSACYVTGGPGGESAPTLDRERLVRDLCAAQADQQPVALLGTAFAFVHFLDHCAAERLRFTLAPGSRVVETGGFKGRSRTVAREELYRLLSRHLGVPATHLINEYGSTELSSQFYDRSLCRGEPTEVKAIPPWTRVQAIDPQTGQPAAAGERGLLRIFALANLGSVLALQTEDLGRLVGTGLVIEGRSAGATVRGCSLDAESLAVRQSAATAASNSPALNHQDTDTAGQVDRVGPGGSR